MMDKNQIANMADFIAKAVHKQAAPDEDWPELTEDERNDFRLIAHAAMGAHDAWLATSGYKIVKLNRKGQRAEIKRVGLVDSQGRELSGRA